MHNDYLMFSEWILNKSENLFEGVAFSVRSLFGEVAIHCMVRDPGLYGLLFCQLVMSYYKRKTE